MAITYKIQRSSRRKTIGIKIEAYTGKLTVFAPKLTPLSRIEEVVKRREGWIIEKVGAVAAINSILPRLFSPVNFIVFLCSEALEFALILMLPRLFSMLQSTTQSAGT